MKRENRLSSDGENVWIGRVKLLRQNELSHREKRSVPHVDRHFHLVGRLQDRADEPLAIALAFVDICSKNPIDRLWKDTLYNRWVKSWSADNAMILDVDCAEKLFTNPSLFAIVRRQCCLLLPRVKLLSPERKRGGGERGREKEKLELDEIRNDRTRWE